MDADKLVLQTKKQILKDSIVELASRLVKDTEDAVKVRGVYEVGARWVEMLDKKLFELDQLEIQINKL
jgi:hypothetical protein